MELPQADAANRSGYSVKSAKTIAPINRDLKRPNQSRAPLFTCQACGRRGADLRLQIRQPNMVWPSIGAEAANARRSISPRVTF